MKPSSFEQAIQAQFDSLTKKVIIQTASNLRKELARRGNREAVFSELTQQEMNRFCVYDMYVSDYTPFNVYGISVLVGDDKLSEALAQLSEQKRNIILLSYFMDMSDAEIAEVMNLVRTTVYRHRTNTLEMIRKIMEEKE